MRRLVIVVLAVLLLFTVLGWADSITAGSLLQVNLSATWVGNTNQYCASNCSETIVASFLINPANINEDFGEGTVDASTFQISSSGVLGSFAPPVTNGKIPVNSGPALWIPLINNEYEIDLEFSLSNIVGTNTVRPGIYGCNTLTCAYTFGTWETYYGSTILHVPLFIDATYSTSSVSTVAVPEPSALVMLLFSSVGLIIGRAHRFGAWVS